MQLSFSLTNSITHNLRDKNVQLHHTFFENYTYLWFNGYNCKRNIIEWTPFPGNFPCAAVLTTSHSHPHSFAKSQMNEDEKGKKLGKLQYIVVHHTFQRNHTVKTVLFLFLSLTTCLLFLWIFLLSFSNNKIFCFHNCVVVGE